jgi:outer membrane protein
MNKNKFTRSALFALVFWVPVVHAEDLLQIYQLALENDPTYKQEEARLQSTIEAKGQVDANYLPSLDINGSTTRSRNHNAISTSSTTSSLYGATISQSIFNRTNIIQSRLAKSSIEQAQAQFAAAKQDLIIRVSQAYFGVLSAQDNLQFSNAQQKAIGRQLEQTKQRFDVGLVAITDVHESQARFDLSRADTIAAENQLNNARERLRSITGRYHENLAVLSDKTPFVARPDPDNIDTWTEMALDKNYSLLASQQAVVQAQEQVNLQRAGYYPILDLNASYLKNMGPDTQTTAADGSPITVSGDSDTTSVTLNLHMNLYSGGYTSSAVAQERQNLIFARESYEANKRGVQQNAHSAYLGVISNISRVQALKQAVISNESALKAAQAGFEVGTRTTVDVLNARSQLFSAINNHSQSRYDYVLSWLNLYQAAGGLDRSILEKIDKWLVEKK